MRARILTALCLLVLGPTVLAGCSAEPAALPTNPATPEARTLEESWSRLYDQARDRRPISTRLCLRGGHGARVSVSTVGRETNVFRFSRGACTYRAGAIVLRWPEGHDPVLVRGERAMRRVPTLHAQLLDLRQFAVQDDVVQFAQAARRIKRSTGAFPASYDAARFERRQYWRGSRILLDYRPDAAGRQFQLCVRYDVVDGPWRTYDTEAGGVVSLGDTGRCTFRPPRPGSETALRLTAERLEPAMAAVDLAGARVPSPRADRILARFDVRLGEGVRLVRAGPILDEEDYPAGSRFCVQHGSRGAWAVSDTSVGIVSGPSGRCDWQLRTAPERF